MATIQALLAVDNASDNPIERRVRQQLLADILKKNASFIISHEDYQLSTEELTEYHKSLTLLSSGVPYAYVIGCQAFWKHEFLVNKHTLIPRPDTEILIETVVNHYKSSLSEPFKILDLGTGSGCIAITLAKEFKNAQVTAIDLSEQALNVAKQNAHNIVAKNIEFLQGSWFEPFTGLSSVKTSKFDIIVSNPPYIDPKDPHLAELTEEPITALIADNEGMADICHIVTNAPNFLNQNGLLAVEHGYDQGQQARLVFETNGFDAIATVKDYGGNDRVTVGVYK